MRFKPPDLIINGLKVPTISKMWRMMIQKQNMNL